MSDPRGASHVRQGRIEWISTLAVRGTESMCQRDITWQRGVLLDQSRHDCFGITRLPIACFTLNHQLSLFRFVLSYPLPLAVYHGDLQTTRPGAAASSDSPTGFPLYHGSFQRARGGRSGSY